MTTLKDIEEIAKDFAHKLSGSVYHFAGKGQYEEGSDEQKAYLDGVSTAVGMMTIDILGGVKSQGLFKPYLTTLTQHHEAEVERRVEVERERILVEISNCQQEHYVSRHGYTVDDAYERVYDYIKFTTAPTKTDKQIEV